MSGVELQRVAACRSVLQCVAVELCSLSCGHSHVVNCVLQYVAVCRSVLQCVALYGSMLQSIAAADHSLLCSHFYNLDPLL